MGGDRVFTLLVATLGQIHNTVILNAVVLYIYNKK